ncbi:MAG: 4-hydroxylaminobenzoate lyase [Planctomycetota bacterium]|jgi:hypothetical protein
MKEELVAAIEAIVEDLQALDLGDPKTAESELGKRLPMESERITRIRRLMESGMESGWLLDKEHNGIRFGRISGDIAGFSADAVLLSGPGPRHRHPHGEIDLLFTLEGEAKFDGGAAGWMVYAPDSVHVPTVSEGSMLILYLLPQGSIEFC